MQTKSVIVEQREIPLFSGGANSFPSAINMQRLKQTSALCFHLSLTTHHLSLFLLFFLSLMVYVPLTAQQNIFLTPTVQPANGGHTQVGNFAFDFTIGEPVQTTVRNGNLMLAQGFQQPEKGTEKQTFESGVVWVTVKNPSLSPIIKSHSTTISTGDAHLNHLFQLMKVTSYKKIAEESKHDLLKNAYEIHCDCNESILKDSLSHNFVGGLTNVSRLPIGESMYTPNDYTNNYGFTGGRPLWYLDTIRAKLAWDLSKGDSSIKIAIIDNYFDVYNQNIESKILGRLNMFTNDTIMDTNPNHCDHGSIVAGIAACSTDDSAGYSSIGFKSNLLLYGIGLPNSANLCAPISISAGFKAIHQAMMDGADVINMSWGGYTTYVPGVGGEYLDPDSFYLYTTAYIDEAYEAGITLVAAEGNCGEHGGCTLKDYNTGLIHDTINLPSFPASHAKVIAVASVDTTDKKSYFSSYHGYVDISAPGNDLPIFEPTFGDSSPDTISTFALGCSFAAPLVSGTAGLILAKNPCLTEADIKYIIQRSAKNIDSLNLIYHDSLGAGRLDAYKALQLTVDSFLARPFTYANGFTVLSDSVVTWQGNYLIHGKVIIKDRGKLIINGGSTVEFDYIDSSGIFVEPGGYLELDSAKLTSRVDCKRKMWRGIEMWGNPTANMTNGISSYTSGISKCKIRNHSIVENALIGIKAGNTNFVDANRSPIGGCLIDAEESSFTNNWRSVVLGWYNGYNHSNFKDCIFQQTEPLKDIVKINTREMDAFVFLESVKNIYFQGCTFQNYLYRDNSSRFGTGILAFNSGLTLKPYNGSDSCHFSGLYKGIDAYQFGAFDKNMNIRKAVFDSVSRCIISNGSKYDRIYESVFNIQFDSTVVRMDTFPSLGNDKYYAVRKSTYGIFMYNCSGFNVSGNEINSSPTFDSLVNNSDPAYRHLYSHGIVIRNSANAGAVVRLNNFNTVDVGVQTEENNPNARFICNEFDGNGYAMNINPRFEQDDDDANTYDTLSTQGYYCADGKTADNSFSNSGFIDVNNPAGLWFKYYAPESPSGRVPAYMENDDKDTVYFCAGITDDQSCNPYYINSTNYYPPNYTSGCLGCMVLSNTITDGARLADSLLAISSPIEKQLAANDIIHSFLERMDSTGEVEIKRFLDRWNSKEANMVMASSFQYVNNKNAARAYLDSLTGLSSDEARQKKIVDTLMIIFYDSTNTWTLMNSDELKFFTTHASGGYISNVYAQSALAMFGDKRYNRVPQDAIAQGEERMLRKPITTKTQPVTEVKLYPNPANNTISVEYETELASMLIIYDLLGKKAFEQKTESGSINVNINLANFMSGTYILNVQSDNVSYCFKKFIVTH